MTNNRLGRVILILLILTALAAPVWAQEDSPDQDEVSERARLHLDLGDTHFRNGQTQEALKAYQQALKIQPELAQIHYSLGLAYASLKQFPEALAAFQTAARLRPTSAKAQNNLGVAYIKMQMWPEAVKAL